MTVDMKNQLKVLITQAKIYNQDAINRWNNGDDPLEFLLLVRDCVNEAFEILHKEE